MEYNEYNDLFSVLNRSLKEVNNLCHENRLESVYQGLQFVEGFQLSES